MSASTGDAPTGGTPGNSSPIGRLLEEISWEGNARAYRSGGRGRENVLTTEVFLALDFLPRSHFLGRLLQGAIGADDARSEICRTIEEAAIDVLPGNIQCGTSAKPTIQPDALIETAANVCLVEAKRIIGSPTFQRPQITRSVQALHHRSQSRTGLLLLVVPTAPPVAVAGLGRMSIEDAVRLGISDCAHPREVLELEAFAAQSVAWITWAQIAAIVRSSAEQLETADGSLAATVQRLAQSVVRAIEWHGHAGMAD